MKIKIKLAALADIMQACAGFTTTESRAILEFIQLKCKNKICIATALDGNRVRTVTVPFIDGDDGTYYIPSLKMPKPCFRNNTAIIETDGKTTTVTMESKTSAHKIPKGDFPDTEKFLLPSEPMYECIFEVGNFLDTMKGFNRKDKFRFISHGVSKPHIIKKLKTNGDYALIVPCSFSKDDSGG